MKTLLKKIPGFTALKKFWQYHTKQSLRDKTPSEVFSAIYEKNTWRSKESRSGTGSDAIQTQVVRIELPVLLKSLEIKTMLDIPCGDFHWMKDVDLGETDYLGADIVSQIIDSNNETFMGAGLKRAFKRLDLLTDKLPQVDLIFCRDCLVHLSYDDLFQALQNICISQSRYLLTTTFTDRVKNHDILTGDWRAINLQVAPFNLPKPCQLLNEKCTEDDGAYLDKSLALWRVDDLRNHLATLE